MVVLVNEQKKPSNIQKHLLRVVLSFKRGIFFLWRQLHAQYQLWSFNNDEEWSKDSTLNLTLPLGNSSWGRFRFLVSDIHGNEKIKCVLRVFFINDICDGCDNVRQSSPVNSECVSAVGWQFDTSCETSTSHAVAKQHHFFPWTNSAHLHYSNNNQSLMGGSGSKTKYEIVIVGLEYASNYHSWCFFVLSDSKIYFNPIFVVKLHFLSVLNQKGVECYSSPLFFNENILHWEQNYSHNPSLISCLNDSLSLCSISVSLPAVPKKQEKQLIYDINYQLLFDFFVFYVRLNWMHFDRIYLINSILISSLFGIHIMSNWRISLW